MNKDEEKTIRERLEEQRALIAEEIDRHGRRLESGAMREFRDPEDRAAAISELWVDDRIVQDDGHLLEKIDLALKRLKEGTYHICASCGGKIPIARLLAKPSASLCVPCQEKKDTAKTS